jgi:hypothetical protein
MSKIKKEELLSNYWDSMVSKGLSKTKKRELDNWMVNEYGDSWIRRTRPSIKEELIIFLNFFKKILNSIGVFTLIKYITSFLPKRKEKNGSRFKGLGNISSTASIEVPIGIGKTKSVVSTKGMGRPKKLTKEQILAMGFVAVAGGLLAYSCLKSKRKGK